MDTLEYMKLVCGILTVIITYGGFRMYTDRRKYIQEVEKLKAEVRDAQVNTPWQRAGQRSESDANPDG